MLITSGWAMRWLKYSCPLDNIIICLLYIECTNPNSHIWLHLPLHMAIRAWRLQCQTSHLNFSFVSNVASYTPNLIAHEMNWTPDFSQYWRSLILSLKIPLNSFGRIRIHDKSLRCMLLMQWTSQFYLVKDKRKRRKKNMLPLILHLILNCVTHIQKISIHESIFKWIW